jgi:CheY-like chemotaxis protein
MEVSSTHRYVAPIARRLLLVEDNELLAELTAEFLRGVGLEVRVAETGREALLSVSEFQPEIVLCDLNLPDMSGADLARALRTDSATRSVLFVIHTALGETDFDHVAGSGIDLFLPKPIDEKKLERLLKLKAETFEKGATADAP